MGRKPTMKSESKEAVQSPKNNIADARGPDIAAPPGSPADYKLLSDVLTSPAPSVNGAGNYSSQSSRAQRTVPSSREWFGNGSVGGALGREDLQFLGGTTSPSSVPIIGQSGAYISSNGIAEENNNNKNEKNSILGVGLFGCSSGSPGGSRLRASSLGLSGLGAKTFNPFSPGTFQADRSPGMLEISPGGHMDTMLDSAAGVAQVGTEGERKNMGIAFASQYVDFDNINALNTSATYHTITSSPTGFEDSNHSNHSSSSSSSSSSSRIGSKRKGTSVATYSANKRYTPRTVKSTHVSPQNNGSPATTDKRGKGRKSKTPSPSAVSANGVYRSPSTASGNPTQVSPEGAQQKVRCNCRKTKCIKLYCDCFRISKFCDGCNCVDCSNTGEKEAERKSAISGILERNPDAFAPRIKDDPNNNTKGHLSGCHCKKSACLKKYCECFSAHVSCSDKCRCLDCKNRDKDSSGGDAPGTGLDTIIEVSPLGLLNGVPDLSHGTGVYISDHIKSPLRGHNSLLEDDMLSTFM